VKETKDLPENILAMPWHAFPKWLRGKLQSV